MNKAPHLAVCFGLLVVLIAMTPMLALAPVWLGNQLVTLVVAIMLLLLPWAPESDIRGSFAISRPLQASAFVTAAWMLFQIIPVPPGTVENAVWRSAGAAIPGGVTGHISIDLGYTLRALFGYLSLASLAFITAVLTRNRERAEIILFTLCTITTFIAVELLLLRGLALFKLRTPPGDFDAPLAALAAFGLIMDVAFVIRAAERHGSRGRLHRGSPPHHAAMPLLGLMGVSACLAALLVSLTYDALIFMASGLIVVSLVVLIRRLNIVRWTAATACVAAAVAWGGVIALRFAAHASASPLFRFAQLDSAETAAATLRMISDARWAGQGVGCYQALAAMYRDSFGVPGEAAVNTVASMLLEWGSVGLLITTALLIQLIVVLFRGALSRGRDSFYASAAAGCLVTLLCQAFCDNSLADVAVQTIAAVIVGLGLSQTAGRQPA